MSKPNSPIRQLLDLEEEVSEARDSLMRLTERLAEVKPTAERAIQEAADRLLVNEDGQPANMGVYWWRAQALVRINGAVTIIPMKTMDEEEVFIFPQPEVEEEAA